MDFDFQEMLIVSVSYHPTMLYVKTHTVLFYTMLYYTKSSLIGVVV